VLNCCQTTTQFTQESRFFLQYWY